MSDVLVECAERVMTLTLNRPAKKNALTDAMYGALADNLERAAQDDAVHVALLRGEGADFCAGNDIGDFVAALTRGVDRSALNVWRFLTAISTFPKPLVAAVTGKAVGVGTTMLLHCDLVFVAEDGELRTPFVDLGLVPEAGSARLLPARIGHVRAFSMFTGKIVSGKTAAAWGLANQALSDDEVVPTALAAAKALAQKPLASVMATKALMRDSALIEAALAADRVAFLTALNSPAAAAAFAAFQAKNKR
jgi:enoyl-CoA hydratase/carnithine racemase